MDDEMMRPWREVGKDEEDMSVKSCELVVAQTQVKKMEASKGNKRKMGPIGPRRCCRKLGADRTARRQEK